MSSFSEDSFVDSGDAREVRLSSKIEEFEHAWKNEPPRPGINNFLGNVPEEDCESLLKALIEIDLHHRRNKNEFPSVDDYLTTLGASRHDVIHAAFKSAESEPTDVWSSQKCVDPQRMRAEHQPLAQNTEIGDFRIIKQIGRGGMGCVYSAWDQVLKREVAVKTLLPRASTDRFVAESLITAKLPHPGIPPVHRLGQLEDGSPYLVMKLIQGDTLANVLTERPQEQVGYSQRFIQIFEQIAQTVGFAHTLDIVHRDLKPSNIMVGGHGDVYVMDWGLAKDLHSSSSDLTADITDNFVPPHPATIGPVGTPGYMAPEQARGETVGKQADVFSLGAILTVILTGRPAFSGINLSDVILHAAGADLSEALQRINECGADAELIALAKRCLEADSKDRFADAHEVSEAVVAYQNSRDSRLRQLETEQAESLVREAEERKRRKVWIGLAATLLIGVLASSILAVWANNAREDAVAADEKSHQRLIDQFVASGEQGWKVGDHFAAAGWFAAALREDETRLSSLVAEQSKISPAELHRRCILNSLRQVPIPTKVFFHDEQPTFAEFDATGEKVVSAAGRQVKIWNRESGKVLFTLPEQSEVVSVARFHPSEEQVLITSGDTAKVFTLGDDNPLAELKREGETFAIAAFSPSGDCSVFVTHDMAGNSKAVVRSSEGRVTVCDPSDYISWLDITRDASWVVTVSGKRAQVWNGSNGEKVMEFQHGSPISAAVFNHSGTYVAIAGIDGSIKLWSLKESSKDAKWSVPLNLNGTISFVAFSEDDTNILVNTNENAHAVLATQNGQQLSYGLFPTISIAYRTGISPRHECPNLDYYLLISDDRSVRVCDPSRFYPDAMHFFSQGLISSIDQSRHGTYLVAQRAHDGARVIWDTRTGNPLELGELTTASFSSSEEYVATLRDGVLSVVKLDSDEQPKPIGDTFPDVLTLRYSTDSKSLILQEGSAIRQVSADDGRLLKQFSKKGEHFLEAKLNADGNRLLSVSVAKEIYDKFLQLPEAKRLDVARSGSLSSEGIVRLWDVSTGKSLTRLDGVTKGAAFFSPDGTYVYGICGREIVRFWDVESGKVSTEYDHPNLMWVALNADNSRLVTLAHDGSMRLWDTANSNTLLLSEKLPGQSVGVAFSPNGQEFIVGAGPIARVYSSETGRPLGPILRHTSNIACVMFMNDSRRVLTAVYDAPFSIIRLWEIADDDTWASQDLIATSEFMGGVYENGSLVPVTPVKSAEAWNKLSLNHKATKKQPDYQRAAYHYEQAVRRFATLDYHRAGTHYFNLINDSQLSNTQRAMYLTRRGDIRVRQNRLLEARKDFDDAVKMDPNNPEGWLWRAHLNISDRRWQSAIDDATQAINQGWLGIAVQNPVTTPRSWPWEIRGLGHAELEQWESAVSDLRKALEEAAYADPNQMLPAAITRELSICHQLAICLLKMGKEEEFEKLRQQYLVRFSGANDIDASNSVLRLITLRSLKSWDKKRIELLGGLNKTSMSEISAAGKTNEAYMMLRLGMVNEPSIYNAIDVAIRLLDENATPRHWLLMAIASRFRGQIEESRKLLKKSEDWLENGRKLRKARAVNAPSYYEMLEYEWLYHEAAEPLLTNYIAALDVPAVPAVDVLRHDLQALANAQDRPSQIRRAKLRLQIGLLTEEDGYTGWSKVADELELLPSDEANDISMLEVCYYRGLALAASGDTEGFRKLANDLLERYPNPKSALTYNAITRTLSLATLDEPTLARFLKLQAPSGSIPDWISLTAIPFQAGGDASGSIAKLRASTFWQSIDKIDRVKADLIEAIAQLRAGQIAGTERFEAATATARKLLEEESFTWSKRLELKILLKQTQRIAEQLQESKDAD